MQQKMFLIGPILLLYYEESLVSSSLNSKLLRFHCAHPNIDICYSKYIEDRFQIVSGNYEENNNEEVHFFGSIPEFLHAVI